MTDRIDETRTGPDGFELERELDARGVPPVEDGLVEAVLDAADTVPPPPPVRTTTAPPPPPAATVTDVPAAPATDDPTDDPDPDVDVDRERDVEESDLAALAVEPARAGLFERAWRRAVRRPTDWAHRPWPNDRIVRLLVTVLALGCTTAVMMNVVHLNPLRPGEDLVFDNTTPTGGDRVDPAKRRCSAPRSCNTSLSRGAKNSG